MVLRQDAVDLMGKKKSKRAKTRARVYISLLVVGSGGCGGARDREACWADASVGGERTGKPMATFGARVGALEKNGSTRAVLSSHQRSGIGKKTTPCDDHRLGGKRGHAELLSVSCPDTPILGWVAVIFSSRAARVPNFKVLGWADPVV